MSMWEYMEQKDNEGPNGLPKSTRQDTRISDLERQVAALTKELAEAKRDRDRAYQGSEPQTREQLAAAQAVSERLREALKYYALGGRNGDRLKEALALHNDTTALQARLAEEREKVATFVSEYGYEHNIITTRICNAIRSMK